MVYQGSKQKQLDARRLLIDYAQKHGIKAASKKFECSRNTIRLWLKRFQGKGPSGLLDKSRAPKTCPHKLDKTIENKILQARKQAPCYGPKRLKYFFIIGVSEGAIYRVLKENNLIKKKKKKYQKKNDLREVKAKYKALSHHQLDVKHLYDIANYWPQMKDHELPKYQYTIRDTKSGMIYLGFGREYCFSSFFKALKMAAKGIFSVT